MIENGLIDELVSRAGSLKLSDVGEKVILRDYILPLCRSICGDHGLGDDAGVVAFPQGEDMVVTTDRIPTDLLAEQFGLMSPRELGAYLVRVNVSDLAAMGSTPLALVVTCSFRKDALVADLLEVMTGVYVDAMRFGCPVIGGDTKASEERSLSATAIGTVPHGRAIGRFGVEPGMRIYLSGPVGHGGAALRWFNNPPGERHRLAGDKALCHEFDGYFRERLVRPEPRVDLVDVLLEARCPAAMDITDGLGQSLAELAENSNVRVVLDLERLRLDRTTRHAIDALGVPVAELIGGIGLDLELVVIADRNPDAAGFYEVGYVGEGDPGVVDARGDALAIRGFEHFSSSPQDYLK